MESKCLNTYFLPMRKITKAKDSEEEEAHQRWAVGVEQSSVTPKLDFYALREVTVNKYKLILISQDLNQKKIVYLTSIKCSNLFR